MNLSLFKPDIHSRGLLNEKENSYYGNNSYYFGLWAGFVLLLWLREVGFGSGPDGLTIIEYDQESNQYYVLFNNTLDNEGFEDLVGDGAYELYGLSGSSAEHGWMLYDRQEMAFEIKNNKYHKSYNATKLLLEKRQREGEEKFYKELVVDYNAYQLILVNAKLGLIEKGEEVISKFAEIKEDVDIDGIRKAFYHYLEAYEEWWAQLKKVSENAWHKYRFPYPEIFTTWQINSQELSWQDSLVKRLKYSRTPVIYALTDINFYRDGKLVEKSVYQNTSRKNQFYILLDNDFLIIDLGIQKVGTAGTGAISYHRNPDGNIVVCLNYSLQNAIGVPLGTPKMDYPEPEFGEKEVRWDYH